MNQGQEMFYNFFMERAKDDKKEEARELLEEGFARQAAGTFNKAYLQEIMPKYFAVIKPEAVEELKQAMEHFASRL
jgi:hypothetical protein